MTCYTVVIIKAGFCLNPAVSLFSFFFFVFRLPSFILPCFVFLIAVPMGMSTARFDFLGN